MKLQVGGEGIRNPKGRGKEYETESREEGVQPASQGTSSAKSRGGAVKSAIEGPQKIWNRSNKSYDDS